MASQNDELSSHRTRTNRRPEPVPVTTASTAVLNPADAQQTSER